MTEKRFSIKAGSIIGLSSIYTDNGKVMTQLEVLDVLIKQYETIQTLTKENEQLKQQIKIFEKFLEGNDLSIDWDEFCGVDECAFENPDFSCKECIHLKGDVE